SGTGTNHGIYKGTAATPIVSDYNDFHINGSGSNHVGYSGSNQTTLANWQSASSQDANSLDVEPMFAGAAIGDLTPSNGALDNQVTPVRVTTDINGAARDPLTPDIGAFVFTVGACQGQPFAGTAFGDLAVWPGAPVNLNDTGFPAGTGIAFQ